jgi:hypothetical protein
MGNQSQVIELVKLFYVKNVFQYKYYKLKFQKENRKKQINPNFQSIKIPNFPDIQVLKFDYLGFEIYLNFAFCYLVIQ